MSFWIAGKVPAPGVEPSIHGSSEFVVVPALDVMYGTRMSAT